MTTGSILLLNTFTNFTEVRLINHDTYIHLFRSDWAQDNGERRKLRNQRVTVQPESRWFICLPTGAALQPRNRADIFADEPKRGREGKARVIISPRTTFLTLWKVFDESHEPDLESPNPLQSPKWRFDIVVHFIAVQPCLGMLERCKITGYRATERGISF